MGPLGTAAKLALLDTEGEHAADAASYVQFVFNGSLVIGFLYIVTQFVLAVKRDVEERIDEYSVGETATTWTTIGRADRQSTSRKSQSVLAPTSQTGAKRARASPPCKSS